MNSVHALPRLWPGFAVLIVGIVLVQDVVPDEPAKEKKPKADAGRAAKMVDAIVNRNKAPKVVPWKGDFLTREAALFPEDHDWKEEERARKAIDQLEKDRTEEVWE